MDVLRSAASLTAKRVALAGLELDAVIDTRKGFDSFLPLIPRSPVESKTVVVGATKPVVEMETNPSRVALVEQMAVPLDCEVLQRAIESRLAGIGLAPRNAAVINFAVVLRSARKLKAAVCRFEAKGPRKVT